MWATVPALWNLRWQVNGFLHEVPKATDQDLLGRFVVGSGVHGSNLRRACVTTGWEEQRSLFASVALTNAFAIYEHWADDILAELGVTDVTGKALQFPAAKGKTGLESVVSKLTKTESPLLRRSFYAALTKSKKYTWSHIGNLMLCYRYFKEARNSQIHNGGKASKRAQAAHAEFAPVSSKIHLGIKESLTLDPLVEGEPFSLYLRSVVGFCDILLRIMASVDAELSRSAKAEATLASMLRKAKPKQTLLSADTQRRNSQIEKRCAAAGLPQPANCAAVYQFMVAQGIVGV
jgi:hypothetical protein